ncbi:MAG: hypothetical protein KGH80_05225 [Xanthomonadaceae bacterium]|nr:hypothetical protein [Xanthomonadaceae bacterium]
MTDAHDKIGSHDSCRRDEPMKSRARRFDMKALCNLFVLMLASIALASCGGGGGGNNSAFGGAPVLTVSVSASPASITTNSFTTLTVTVKNPDGTPAQNGAAVQATLNPSTIGSLSAGSTSGSTVSSTLSGGTASFLFNSSNQTGTAHITASVTIVTTGSVSGTVSFTGSVDVNVTPGSTQDPRLQLSPTAVSLPLNPFAAQAETFPFPSNYLGSPWISEVTVTWRHSNGQLVAGTTKVNVSIDPVSIASFSTLDDPTTPWTGQTANPPTVTGNEFLTLLGSGPINVTGGNGVIFVHANDTPGTAVLSVVAIDPDSGQTISSQLPITIAGASSNLPASITASSDGGAYVSGSSGPQSAQVRAAVTDGSNAFVPDPSGFDNVEFTITGPSGTDATLSGINAAGQSISKATTVDTVTHNGIATITVNAGNVQGPVQIKATADRGDGNVDNGIQDPVSSTATVLISDGKLYSLTLQLPNGDAIANSATSSGAVETPTGSGNYALTISAKGVDRQGQSVLPGTVIGFGAIDSPQSPIASASPSGWFQLSGSKGDPQEGGNLFTALDGKFTTAGGGAGPGDTLLVIGKASEGAPPGNDDLESSSKIVTVNSATSLNVATVFNRNDTTGVSVNAGPVLPYIIGRGEFGSVVSPANTDAGSTSLTGVATTTLNYPATAIGKAVAIWAQGTGTDAIANITDVVADIGTLVYPGLATGAVMTASPDPLLGNTTESVTVCYYDGNNHPIPNFDVSFAFNFGGVGSGTADGISTSGKFAHLTGANGCVTVPVVTASLKPTTSSTGGPTITFSAGPLNTVSTGGGSPVSVTVPFVVNAAQLQVSCPAAVAGNYTVGLTMLDSSGAGMPGQTITGTCTPSALTVGTIAPTNASGNTTAIISDPTAVAGTCTFQSSSFSSLVASVTISASGAPSCSGGFSPPSH